MVGPQVTAPVSVALSLILCMYLLQYQGPFLGIQVSKFRSLYLYLYFYSIPRYLVMVRCWGPLLGLQVSKYRLLYVPVRLLLILCTCYSTKVPGDGAVLGSFVGPASI